MREDVVVYRAKTNQPKECLDAYEADRKKYARKLKKFVKEISPDADRSAMVSHSVGQGQVDRLVGLNTKRDDWKSPPEGWRLRNRKGDVLVPKRNTPEGKAIYKRMEEMQLEAPADPRVFFAGMPREFHDLRARFRIYEPGVEILAGKVYVVWSVEPDGVDPTLWERIKLSAYYRAREADGSSWS